MPIPDYQSFMRPLLAQLADGNIHTLSEVRENLIDGLVQASGEVLEEKLLINLNKY